MITIRFLGGAKKSFSTDKLEVNKSDIPIDDLLEFLILHKPENTPDLDVNNILIAVNGVDSSAMEGKKTMIKNDDVVSIIPIIHGGTSKITHFELLKKQILVMEIQGQKNIDVTFLDNLRNDFKKLKIQGVLSSYILNISHLKKILILSLIAQKDSILLSNKIETDLLMRFAITSQISDAISKVGIKSANNFILIAIGNKKELQSLSLKLLPNSIGIFTKDNSQFLKKQFNINKNQLDRVLSSDPLEDLLVEKASVLF